MDDVKECIPEQKYNRMFDLLKGIYDKNDYFDNKNSEIKLRIFDLTVMKMRIEKNINELENELQTLTYGNVKNIDKKNVLEKNYNYQGNVNVKEIKEYVNELYKTTSNEVFSKQKYRKMVEEERDRRNENKKEQIITNTDMLKEKLRSVEYELVRTLH